MKKLLIVIAFLSVSIIANAQKIQKIESLITKDSVKTALFKCIIEDCEKSYGRITLDKFSCPVYIDPEGFTFFITIEDGYLAIVEIDHD